MILYFSGTGNSKYIAMKIAGITGDEVISLNEKLKSGSYSLPDYDTLVFVLPTYSWRIPGVIYEWIEKTGFKQGTKTWFVMTCGGETGNAGKYNEELCRRKKLDYMGTAGILMPDNYIIMFPDVSEEEKAEKISRAGIAAEKTAASIKASERFVKNSTSIYDKLKSGAVNDIFYRFCVKDDDFYAGDNCTACMKCVKECPLNNITLSLHKPQWHGKCTHCMRCISVCPSGAIEYGKKTLGKKRYNFNEKGE